MLTSASRSTCSTAEHLELMTESDVLEDQGFASAKRSSDQVQDQFKPPERLAGREL
jgi:hypothetical protein